MVVIGQHPHCGRGLLDNAVQANVLLSDESRKTMRQPNLAALDIFVNLFM
jgi:hypothetical protein